MVIQIICFVVNILLVILIFNRIKVHKGLIKQNETLLEEIKQRHRIKMELNSLTLCEYNQRGYNRGYSDGFKAGKTRYHHKNARGIS